jgi:hypothetical protein
MHVPYIDTPTFRKTMFGAPQTSIDRRERKKCTICSDPIPMGWRRKPPGTERIVRRHNPEVHRTGEYEAIDWTVQNRVRSPWDVGLMRIYAWSFAKGHARSNEPNPFEMLVLLTAMT